MPFNYSKLKGRIAEKELTYQDVANALGINAVCFSRKMRGLYQFTQVEIMNMCDFLEISSEDIKEFFFTSAV